MIGGSSTHDGAGTAADEWRRHPCWGQVPQLTLVNGERPCTRLVVVAAHPSDETLGAGGLIATASAAGLSVYVVLLTAGESSLPHSPSLTRHAMATRRLGEAERALGILAPDAPLVFLGAADGQVAEAEAAVTSSLVDLIGDGQSTLLVAPWRYDGHGEHEAAGRAAAAAALRTGARLMEYPMRMWLRGSPDDCPWFRMRRVDLSTQVAQRKSLAIRAHETQVRPGPEAPPEKVVLPEQVLAHFDSGVEHFVADAPAEAPSETPTDVALGGHPPGRHDSGAEARWSEHRKRQLALAVLPRPRYRRGLHLRGSVDALAADLADRCEELVAVDGASGAVVEELTAAGQWPAGRFDLIVVSEVGNRLSPDGLEELISRVRRSLQPDGTVVLCHGRRGGDGRVLAGSDVHDRFRGSGLAPEVAHYRDREIEISVLGAPGPSSEPTA